MEALQAGVSRPRYASVGHQAYLTYSDAIGTAPRYLRKVSRFAHTNQHGRVDGCGWRGGRESRRDGGMAGYLWQSRGEL